MRATAFMLVAILLATLFGFAPNVAAPVPKLQPLPPATEKEIAASHENLKQLVLALINYAASDANSHLPTDITDKNGKPLLSWRVTVMPFLEGDDLLKEFKLDEPWDSEANKKLIEKMPKVFAPVRVKANVGETFYQVFKGENAIFGSKNKPLFPATFTDGCSNTGLVFESGEPVIWTKPADMPFDGKKPLPKLGGLFDGECNLAMADGSIKTLKKNADEKQLKLLIMPGDGEEIDWTKLVK